MITLLLVLFALLFVICGITVEVTRPDGTDFDLSFGYGRFYHLLLVVQFEPPSSHESESN